MCPNPPNDKKIDSQTLSVTSQPSETKQTKPSRFKEVKSSDVDSNASSNISTLSEILDETPLQHHDSEMKNVETQPHIYHSNRYAQEEKTEAKQIISVNTVTPNAKTDPTFLPHDPHQHVVKLREFVIAIYAATGIPQTKLNELEPNTILAIADIYQELSKAKLLNNDQLSALHDKPNHATDISHAIHYLKKANLLTKNNVDRVFEQPGKLQDIFDNGFRAFLNSDVDLTQKTYQMLLDFFYKHHSDAANIGNAFRSLSPISNNHEHMKNIGWLCEHRDQAEAINHILSLFIACIGYTKSKELLHENHAQQKTSFLACLMNHKNLSQFSTLLTHRLDTDLFAKFPHDTRIRPNKEFLHTLLDELLTPQPSPSLSGTFKHDTKLTPPKSSAQETKPTESKPSPKK